MEFEEPQFYQIRAYAAEQDRDVIDLVSGVPDWDPPAELRAALESYAELETSEYQYPPIEGLAELRAEVAAWRDLERDSVLVTTGAGEANYLAMARALNRGAGSEVVLTDPVYPYYAGRTTLLGGTQTFVPVDDDGYLDPDDVRRATSDDTACIVINSPNNPTGAIYDEKAVRGLVAIAEDRDAILVSDEVYARFAHSKAFTSAARIDSASRIVTGSFSKSLAITGFRVGYAIVPDAHLRAMRSRHMLTDVTVSRPAQYAVARALSETPPAYYTANRERIRERIDAFTSTLDAVGADYTRPDGAFYVMVRFPTLPGNLETVYRLIEDAGVACMPGESFGNRMDDWFRFALVSPRVEQAAERLADFFAE
jgi:aspartate aminotransferase